MAVVANMMKASKPSTKAEKPHKKRIPEQTMLNPGGMVAIRLAALTLRFLMKRNKFSRLKGMPSSPAYAMRKSIRTRKSSCVSVCAQVQQNVPATGMSGMNMQKSIQPSMCLTFRLFIKSLLYEIYFLNIPLFMRIRITAKALGFNLNAFEKGGRWLRPKTRCHSGEKHSFFSMRGPRSQLARKKGPSVATSLRLRYPPDFFLSACARFPRNMIKETQDLLQSLRSLRKPRCINIL